MKRRWRKPRTGRLLYKTVCYKCGKEVKIRKTKATVFCSPECRKEHKKWLSDHLIMLKRCRRCNKQIRIPNKAGYAARKYCSEPCKKVYQRILQQRYYLKKKETL